VIVLAGQLKCVDGSKKGLTFQEISEAFGHEDRQWSHNYYREFQGCGGDIFYFLKRENKLQERVFSLIEQQILKMPLLPLSQGYANFTRAHSEISISEPTFRKYVSRMDSCKLLTRLRKLLTTGQVCPESRTYLKELLETLSVSVEQKKEIVELFPEVEAKQQSHPIDFATSQGQKYLLVTFLYACGLSLDVLSLLFGACKSSIHNWIYRICSVELEHRILCSIQYWSGKISVDEKWIKINRKWHFGLCAVDALSGFPLLMKLHPSIDTTSWEVFFKQFKVIYGKPELIMSDGSKSLRKAKEKVFPGVKHQLCKFHKLKNLMTIIFETIKDNQPLKRSVRLAKHIFSNSYVSSRKYAAKTLEKIATPEVSNYVQKSILTHWRKLTQSVTTNVSERFNRKIEKSISARYGIKSVESAKVLLRALWIKELLLNGRVHLEMTDQMNSIDLSRISQEHLEVNHILHFFDHNNPFDIDIAA